MTDLPQTVQKTVNGVRLAVHEWPGHGPTVFLIHATGFHGRCWDAVVEALNGQHCLAVDVRGHGASDVTLPPYSWATLAEDVAALVQTMDLRDAIGVGHSMGGHLLVGTAAQVPTAFAGLLLIEPVIFDHSIYAKEKPAGEHFAARRRNQWASPQEMLARFAGRPPFATWQARVLRDYCQHGLRPAPDGEGFVLACPPAVEAASLCQRRRTRRRSLPYVGADQCAGACAAGGVTWRAGQPRHAIFAHGAGSGALVPPGARRTSARI